MKVSKWIGLYFAFFMVIILLDIPVWLKMGLLLILQVIILLLASRENSKEKK